MKLEDKKRLRQKRVWRIRKKVRGTAERPRLCLHLSNKHAYAQLIDDERSVTVISASSISSEGREQKLSANCKSAERLGEIIGSRAAESGVNRVVFDRNGRRYHGAVKAFAEAARKAGLQF